MSGPNPPPLTRQLTSHLDQFVQDLGEIENENTNDASMTDNGERAANNDFNFLIGEATDIGGGSVNQDTYCVFKCQDNLVLAVFDGHGRELGELAAIIARDTVKHLLMQDGMMEKISENPQATLTHVFELTHLEIKNRFKEKYLASGWQVEEAEEGYLIKRRNAASNWSCTHGGTTATVVIIFGGSNRVIVANCGDSTALWGGLDKNGDPVFEELSAEHSPESESEFLRVKGLDSSQDMPALRFVYDSPSFSKNQCPQIFRVSQDDKQQLTRTNMGNYFKNVRNEWATLVTTPPHARFQDALAFTRSLGDLHLHVYGVSYIPEVLEYNLADLHAASTKGPYNSSCLLVCTDGVWDNWKYPDIVATCMEQEYVNAAVTTGNGKQSTETFMDKNLTLARKHFGNQADNMTAILAYVIPTKPSVASPANPPNPPTYKP